MIGVVEKIQRVLSVTVTLVSRQSAEYFQRRVFVGCVGVGEAAVRTAVIHHGVHHGTAVFDKSAVRLCVDAESGKGDDHLCRALAVFGAHGFIAARAELHRRQAVERSVDCRADVASAAVRRERLQGHRGDVRVAAGAYHRPAAVAQLPGEDIGHQAVRAVQRAVVAVVEQMQSEHKTHQSQPADRFIGNVGDIAVGTARRRQRQRVFFATRGGVDLVRIEIAEQRVFIARKIVIARLRYGDRVELCAHARAVAQAIVDESLIAPAAVICDDTVAQALHLSDGIGFAGVFGAR